MGDVTRHAALAASYYNCGHISLPDFEGEEESAELMAERQVIAGQGLPHMPTHVPAKPIAAERQFLQSQLSPETNVRVLVSGPMTPKELQKFRWLIWMQELWLSLDKGEQDELKKELAAQIDTASEPK